MDDQEIHDRIMDILEQKILMGAGVSAGYGTKAGAKKALKTKRARGLIAPAKRGRPAKKAARKPAKKAPKKPVKRVAKRKTSLWIEFVKSYAKKHKLSYKDALQDAGPEYRKKYKIRK